MRFESIVLERYGAFQSLDLTLPDTGLTVIHGDNEAGKSTCLSALSDLLYGIPERTTRGAFGNDLMRVGASLRLADGRRLTVRRRKGRGQTLSDAEGVAMDESHLASILGATDRAAFGRLFGLDHEGLRLGGDQLLAADGEIGRLIVEAGGGLGDLNRRLTLLEAEADRLFAPRRSGARAFYAALDDFNDAERRHKAASLSREDWEQARRNLLDAVARLERLRSERQGLAATRSALDRLVRAAPLITQLAELDARVAASAHLAALPATFDVQWASAVATRQARLANAAALRADRDALKARIDALAPDMAVLGLEAQIEALADWIAKVASARADRPHRRDELTADETKLKDLRETLGVAENEDLGLRLPAEAKIAAVRRLAAEADSLAARRRESGRLLAAAKDGLSRLTDRIASARAAGHDRVWAATASEFAALPTAVADVATRTRDVEGERAVLLADCDALIGANIGALRALRAPDPEMLREEIRAREVLVEARRRQIEALATARSDALGAQRDIDRLTAAGPAPTDAAIATARSARDLAWAPIRDAHLNGTPIEPGLDRLAQVQAFEDDVATADDLADRRASEAQRVAQLDQAQHRLEIAGAAAIAAAEAAERVAAELADRDRTFREAFAEVHALRETPQALLALLTAREDILRRSDALMERERDLSLRNAALAPLLDRLAEIEALAGLAPSADAPLAGRVRAVVEAVEIHQRASDALARAEEEALRIEGEVGRHALDLAEIERNEASWRLAWEPSVLALGAEAALAPAEAAALAEQWQAARGVLGSLANTRRRLARMDEDEAQLAARVAALVEGLGGDGSADPVAAAKDMTRRLREADRARTERAALLPELAELERRLAAALAEGEAALTAAARLTKEAGAGAGDDAAVDQVARWVGQRRADLDQRARVLDGLAAVADGFTPDDLRAQLAVRDLDALRGEQESVRLRFQALDSDLEAAVRAEQAAANALAEFGSGEAVVVAAADREAATERMHLAVERYVSLRVARGLIDRAISQVRAERQDPLLRRAGALFARATRDAFSGVAADLDDKGAPVVVGVRSEGTRVGVSAMSDGTRDQLFLAFRLASLEDYARNAEPLPFIADDILVHFDDPRGEATLDLLASVAEESGSQILLFTHHGSVRNAAAALERAGRAGVVDLAGR